MLTDKDIETMRSWREELEDNRLQNILLIVESVEYDFLTGEEIATETELSSESVVTERSSRTASELNLREGEEVREGDLWFSISDRELSRLELSTTEDFDSISYVHHMDRRYRVTAWDRKGIGKWNRVEFLGKVVT